MLGTFLRKSLLVWVLGTIIEGVTNAVLTVNTGITAMELCRPLKFHFCERSKQWRQPGRQICEVLRQYGSWSIFVTNRVTFTTPAGAVLFPTGRQRSRHWAVDAQTTMLRLRGDGTLLIRVMAPRQSSQPERYVRRNDLRAEQDKHAPK